MPTRNQRPGDNMLVMLSELIDKLVSNYDIKLKYIETDTTDPSSYIYVFTSSRHADLYIKTRGDQKDLARLLVKHEIAHLTHINDLIAGYREITETEKLSEADLFSGQYLDVDIVHFAANIISDYAINCGIDTSAYLPMDTTLIESLAASRSDDAYTISMLILLSRHPHTFPVQMFSPPSRVSDPDSEVMGEIPGDIMREIVRLSGSDRFKHLSGLVAAGSTHLAKRRFKGFVESVSALAGELNSVWRSDNTPWRMMKRNTDVLHERTPQYIKQEKFCEFAPETLAQKIGSENVGAGTSALVYGESEHAQLARRLKLPVLLERGLGIERPRLVTRYRGVSTSLTDKKRLILFDSSNMWLERELEKKKQVWVLVDLSSSMTTSIESAKVLTDTIHKYFKSKVKMISFNATADLIDIATLRCAEAGGGTDVSSVIPHLKIDRDDPVALISDFKFLTSH
ncbi:MAG: hypothetical protein U9N12_03155, partial [Euryarchaeota archaeon]|nr:hypothetical protein [Euryarchaeota archaeon]